MADWVPSHQLKLQHPTCAAANILVTLCTYRYPKNLAYSQQQKTEPPMPEAFNISGSSHIYNPALFPSIHWIYFRGRTLTLCYKLGPFYTAYFLWFPAIFFAMLLHSSFLIFYLSLYTSYLSSIFCSLIWNKQSTWVASLFHPFVLLLLGEGGRIAMQFNHHWKHICKME